MDRLAKSLYGCRSIAEAVGKNLGLPVEGIAFPEAVKKEVWVTWMAAVWTYNNRVSSAKAQSQLQWRDFKTNMLQDIAAGSYKA